MAEQIVLPPPVPSGTKSKRGWKWLKILTGITAAGLLGIGLLASYHSQDLELVRRDLFDAAHDGKVLEITNVGSKPIKLVNITVNNRTDCKVFRLEALLGSTKPLFPSVLNVGDELSISGTCQIISATVETDQGSNTYSFKR